jgi:RNA polymerase sigma-70 factor, ECF subfamily
VHDQLSDHLLRIYRFAMHLCGDQHMAEDLAQEAMLRAVRSGNVRDPRAVKVWLLRIVENLWIDWCRTQGRRPTQETADSELEHRQLGPPEQVLQAEEVAKTVAAMHCLPERQRTVLHLIACEELTVIETAEGLQITPEAVRASFSLARARMSSETLFALSICG